MPNQPANFDSHASLIYKCFFCRNKQDSNNLLLYKIVINQNKIKNGIQDFVCKHESTFLSKPPASLCSADLGAS